MCCHSCLVNSIRDHTLDTGTFPWRSLLCLHCCPCEQASHTQTSLTSAANPIAIRAAKCLCWPDHEPQYPMSHLRYWAQPSPPQSFPQHLQRLQTTRLPPLPSVKPSAVRPDFHLESLQVFSPFHTSWPDCFCLFMDLIDMCESNDHEALGGVMDRERYKWLKLQHARRTNKNESCWISCLCIYLASYWFVSLTWARQFRIYPKREKLSLGIIWKCLLLFTAEPICRT